MRERLDEEIRMTLVLSSLAMTNSKSFAAGEVVAASTFEEVLNILHECHDKLVVVDYFATWCGPCMRFSDKFASLASEYATEALFLKVDVDAVPEAMENAQVAALPTFVVFKKGRPLSRCQGASEEGLRAAIEKASSV